MKYLSWQTCWTTVGPSGHSWQPGTAANSTKFNHWLNWRVLLCAIWVLVSMIVVSILIWKCEGSKAKREEDLGVLYDDESRRPCLKEIHPVWLLAFRVVSFFLLLSLLIVYVIIDGASTFYYYTQWTFLLVTIYFGLGSLMSIYGCHRYLKKVNGDRVDNTRLDEESDTHIPPLREKSENDHRPAEKSSIHEIHNVREIAGSWGYAFQIIYQTNAGAVVLTDFVFWFIIVPFLEIKDYDLNFILIGTHSLNAVFLLGDTVLNSSRFPWFRISYFLLWTSGYVIFQWIIHACVSVWWPYPFLDLSSPQAPIWYLVVTLIHIPCYAIFLLIIKMKHNLLSRWFPESYLFTKSN